MHWIKCSESIAFCYFVTEPTKAITLNNVKCKNKDCISFKRSVSYRLTEVVQNVATSSQNSCWSTAHCRKRLHFKIVLSAIYGTAICKAIPFCKDHIHLLSWYPAFCLSDLTTLRLYQSTHPALWRPSSLFSSQSQIFSNRPKQPKGFSLSYCTQKIFSF